MIWPKKPSKPTSAQRWVAMGKRLAEEATAKQQEERDNQVLTKSFAPFWPRGTVGRFYVKKDPAWGDAQGLMAVEQLPVLNVRRIDTGYVLLAGAKGEYLFEVDQNGESKECVPWDDEMQREYELHGEDILPSYDMPEPIDEPEQMTVDHVSEPVGLITQTDEGLYRTTPETPRDRAVREARELIARDAAEARKREAAERTQEGETVGAGARRQRFTEAAGTKPERLSEPGLSTAEAEAVESFVDAENRQEADK